MYPTRECNIRLKPLFNNPSRSSVKLYLYFKLLIGVCQKLVLIMTCPRKTLPV